MTASTQPKTFAKYKSKTKKQEQNKIIIIIIIIIIKIKSKRSKRLGPGPQRLEFLSLLSGLGVRSSSCSLDEKKKEMVYTVYDYKNVLP